MPSIKVQEIEWLQLNNSNQLGYDVLSVLSLGVLPIIHIYYPADGKRLKSALCSPERADFAICRISRDKIDGDEIEEKIVVVDHFAMNNEQLATFEIDGQRFCACNIDGWVLSAVPDVPLNFKRFLVTPPQYKKDIHRVEREILVAQYGLNDMKIAISDINEVIIKNALNPIIVFGYFTAIVWYIQLYYIWASLTLFTCIYAIYFLTQVMLYY